MRIEDIQIHDGEPAGPFEFIADVKAQARAATAMSKAPTLDDVNAKLREQAVKIGADAIINVSYKRGVSAFSWKALTATGQAVALISDEVTCPFCAETIKAAAIRCKHCGADLATV